MLKTVSVIHSLNSGVTTENVWTVLGNLSHRMFKTTFQQGRRRIKPEAYPLGYVEEFDEPRTKLETVSTSY